MILVRPNASLLEFAGFAHRDFVGCKGLTKGGRCVIGRERSRAVLWRSESDDRKGMFILVRGYKSHESVAKDLDT
jgi:hypothetical protein